MAEYIQVFTALRKREDAEKISDILLKHKLAGCVQIIPVESRYRWKGKIERNKEYVCIIKSRQTLYKKIEKIIKAGHPYEIPEIISAPLSGGSRDYLNWLETETGGQQKRYLRRGGK